MVTRVYYHTRKQRTHDQKAPTNKLSLYLVKLHNTTLLDMVQGNCPLCPPYGFKHAQKVHNRAKRYRHRQERRQTREDLEAERGPLKSGRPAYSPWRADYDRRVARHRNKKRNIMHRCAERDAKYADRNAVNTHCLDYK